MRDAWNKVKGGENEGIKSNAVQNDNKKNSNFIKTKRRNYWTILKKKRRKACAPFVKSVLEFQSKLKFYEKVIVALVLANILFAVVVVVTVFSDPLVILEKDAEKLSFQSIRKEVTISEKEIKTCRKLYPSKI